MLFYFPVLKEVMRRRYNQRRVSIGTHLRALPVQCVVQSLCFALLQGIYDNRPRIHCHCLYCVKDALNVSLAALYVLYVTIVKLRWVNKFTRWCDPLANNLNGSRKVFFNYRS